MNALPRNLSLVTTLCVLLSGCAQTGPPLPPSLELPKPPSDLRAGRKGNRVTLTWTEPTRTTDRQSVRYLGPTRICRSLEAEMKECGNPVGQLPPPPGPPQPSRAMQAEPQVFADPLPPPIQEQNPTGDITYAVEVLNRDGRSAGLSNRVQVAAVPTLPPPRPASSTDIGSTGATRLPAKTRSRVRSRLVKPARCILRIRLSNGKRRTCTASLRSAS